MKWCDEECTCLEELAEKEELLIEAEERADENERLLHQCWHFIAESDRVKLIDMEPGLYELVSVGDPYAKPFDKRNRADEQDWTDFKSGDVKSKLHDLFGGKK